MNYPELPLEPPERPIDGAYTCCCCDEVIPGDEWYFEVNGEYYCESCMEDMKHVAPYREEVADYDD